jgi:large subunit ribosomal protein L9
MQVILTENLENVGQQGEIVTVARGFAQNYLIPRGMAIMADERNKHKLEHHKKMIDDKRKREMKEADAVVDRLEEISCEIPVQVGEEEKIFGTVTTSDIAEKLQEKGIEVDRRKIHLEEPIKALGVYTAEVKVAPDKVAHVKVWVVKKES